MIRCLPISRCLKNHNEGHRAPMRQNNVLNKCIYICVLLACLVPRYIATFKLNLGGLKISLYTIITIVVWFLFVRKIKITKTIECVFPFIWFLAIVLDVFRTVKFGVWFYYFVWISTAILFQQILYAENKVSKYKYIVRAINDSLFLHLLMGLYEITTHHYLFETGNINYRLNGNVAIGMFHNLNDYATFLVTMLPFAIYKLFSRCNIVFRLYYLFISIVSFFLIFRSESRAALLACIIMLCIYLYLYMTHTSKVRIFLIAIISLFFVLWFLPSHNEGISSFIAANEVGVDGVNGRSDVARLNLILNGLYFLRITNGFGVGAGNLYAWLEHKAIYPIGDLLFIHNWYVEVLVTFGVIFFILYILFHGRILFLIIKNCNKGAQICNLNNSLLISFVGFSVVSISSSSNIYSEWVWMYLILISTYTMDLSRQKIKVNGI